MDQAADRGEPAIRSDWPARDNRAVTDASTTDTYRELRSPLPDDQLLCHYTCASTALNYILPSRQLRMSPYRRMRDPLENKELHTMLRYVPGVESRGFPLEEAQQLVGEIRAQMRIVCLTTDANGYEEEEVRAFGRAYARGRMWEQYADDHRGICLAFSANCMTEVFYEQIKRFGAATIGPVDYTKAGFVVSDARLIDPSELSEENAARVLTDHVLSHHREFWFLKVLDWDTEYEYRFVVFAPAVAEDEPIDVPFSSCLRAVILGERFEADLVPRARELASALGVGLCRLEWDSGRPSICRVH
jgi:hypothetical protein